MKVNFRLPERARKEKSTGSKGRQDRCRHGVRCGGDVTERDGPCSMKAVAAVQDGKDAMRRRGYLDRHRKVDSRLHGKRNSKLPWRKAGQPSHLVGVVDLDQ